MDYDLIMSASERCLSEKSQKFLDFTKPPVYLFDSTEKCAGTTLKRYLRANFTQDIFFDVDNGDPPTETIRNYGIQCPIHFPPYAQFLDDRETNFYDIFSLYLRDRVRWLEENLRQLNVSCVYGNMVHFTKLASILRPKYDVRLCKFFRNPVSRVVSEYNYVLHNSGHNLYQIAKDSGSLENYICHPERPKNRQVASVLGKFYGEASVAINHINREYFFVGLIESFDHDLEKFANLAHLDKPFIERHNVGPVKVKDETVQEHSNLYNLVVDYDPDDTALYEAISGTETNVLSPKKLCLDY